MQIGFGKIWRPTQSRAVDTQKISNDVAVIAHVKSQAVVWILSPFIGVEGIATQYWRFRFRQYRQKTDGAFGYGQQSLIARKMTTMDRQDRPTLKPVFVA